MFGTFLVLCCFVRYVQYVVSGEGNFSAEGNFLYWGKLFIASTRGIVVAVLV